MARSLSPQKAENGEYYQSDQPANVYELKPKRIISKSKKFPSVYDQKSQSKYKQYNMKPKL